MYRTVPKYELHLNKYDKLSATNYYLIGTLFLCYQGLITIGTKVCSISRTHFLRGFMNLVFVSRIWLFVLAVGFGFFKMWLFDLSRFNPEFGFSLKMDSQKTETSLKWILWIRISETALTNTFLFSFRFQTESKQNQNQTKWNWNWFWIL